MLLQYKVRCKCMYAINYDCLFSSEETFGALLGSPFQSEASSPLRYHPYTERDDFMEYDYHFQRSCCFSAADDMCPTYTNQRRADECLSYTPSEFGMSFVMDRGIYTNHMCSAGIRMLSIYYN